MSDLLLFCYLFFLKNCVFWDFGLGSQKVGIPFPPKSMILKPSSPKVSIFLPLGNPDNSSMAEEDSMQGLTQTLLA